ncbi:MAG: bifunctional DNA-formamidopyrimidine glycosylase/DNA-(apurinic or apyrimidinic site) lyase [Mailhella sp.]|nr:bifunctional DNA-formamidopyrimidine glycosylase/DNA-(apurinic or apyrimidinic site) lyase [Mailhella sp.]
MPELPEVETVARTLAPQVCGRRIVGISVLNAGTWQGGTAAGDVEALRPCIRGISRRGKLLILHFGEGGPEACEAGIEIPVPTSAEHWPLFYSAAGLERGRLGLVGKFPHEITALAFHLRMTGRLFVYPQGTEPGAHTRVVFTLDDGRLLFFDDTRKFGQVRGLCSAELDAWKFWRELGPEPLEMSGEEFVGRFGSRKAVKSLLLDQGIVAGVGNIYADESLFRAGIRPDARGCDIEAERLAALHVALVEVLLLSIRECGSSIRDYRTARGDVGAFQNSFFVYGRAGEACRVCGTRLESTRTAGRATVFCPKCQKY